jgi:hypothetical protein
MGWGRVDPAPPAPINTARMEKKTRDIRIFERKRGEKKETETVKTRGEEKKTWEILAGKKG